MDDSHPRGVVVAIYTAAAAGAAAEQVRHVEVIAGAGLAGDRYALGTGHWSAWPDPAGKALTLVDSDTLAGAGLSGAEVRRNVVTRGVDLRGLIGEVFSIGEVVCTGVRPCDPCRYLEDRTRPGLRATLRDGRGGLRADVVGGGHIAVGDAVG